MILIADAGGSNTSWRVIRDDNRIEQLKTAGINLVHSRIEDFLSEVKDQLAPFKEADTVHFYVAGLTSVDQHDEVAMNFGYFFTKARIRVESDLLAAARSLCLDERGWAGILGTGANMAYFDGNKIVRSISPLGYILGDEGSGAYLGKKLLVDYCRERMPSEVREKINDRFSLSLQEILEKTYRGDESKQFLASFSKFLFQNIAHPYCYQLVYDGFTDHFRAFLTDTDAEEVVHYTGSVAFYFSNILRQAAKDHGIKIGNVTESPIAGLTLYHQKYS